MSIRSRLSKIRPKPVKIRVPDWEDEEVCILPLSFEEEEEVEQKERDAQSGEAGAREVILQTVLERLVDESGERLYGDSKDDIQELKELPADGVHFVYQALANRSIRRAAMVKGAKGN